jgi:hypothetical protein
VQRHEVRPTCSDGAWVSEPSGRPVTGSRSLSTRRGPHAARLEPKISQWAEGSDSPSQLLSNRPLETNRRIWPSTRSLVRSLTAYSLSKTDMSSRLG